MKLVLVPVKFSYRGTTGGLFQHLGFPLRVLLKYLRKSPCWPGFELISQWDAEWRQCRLAAHPDASSSFWQACGGHSPLPVWTELWWSTTGTIWSCQIFLDAFQQGFYILWSSVDVCSTCLCGFSWSCQRAQQPGEHRCHRRRYPVVSVSFPWRDSRGLLQHLFTLKIIFNGDYQVVVCHHSSLPGRSGKCSLPRSGETTLAASNTNTA